MVSWAQRYYVKDRVGLGRGACSLRGGVGCKVGSASAEHGGGVESGVVVEVVGRVSIGRK
ncbi:hypothetical protein KI387_008898, partial [Taxus chinensis]